MSKFKEFGFYAITIIVVAGLTFGFNYMGSQKKDIVYSTCEVVENPTLLWINDRLPTQADCHNRVGIVWVYNGGRAKIRFYNNVQEGTWWATIKSPIGPRERWVDNLIDAIEGEHSHD